MGFRDADRGQAIQIGAILLFAIAIIGISLYQATVVPQQNARVEFNGYQQASGDMVSLRNDIISAAISGDESGTAIKTGVTYPERSIFVNPGTPTGTVSTNDGAPNVSVSGVRAVEGEAENTQAFWNATSGEYETSTISFSPAYNEFDGSPIDIVGQDVYRTPDSRVLPISQGSTIRGNRITLVTVRGDLNAAGLSVPVTAEPVSVATRTVMVTGTGSSFDVTVPTTGNATAWNLAVGSDILSNPNVESVTPHGNGSATITFNGSRQYRLRLAVVEVRGRSNAAVVDSPPGAYLVPITQNETAFETRSKPVVAEVRNRYNNPVSGATVTFEVTDSSGTFKGNATTKTVVTDPEGRASVEFTPTSTGEATVEASADLNENGMYESYETHTYEFVTLTADGGATGGNGTDTNTGDINPGEKGDVLLEFAETDQSADSMGGGGSGLTANEIRISFNNTADEQRTIVDARFAFYYPSSSSSGAESPANITMGGTDLKIPGPYTTLNNKITLNEGPGQSFIVVANGGNSVPVPNDFLILSVRYEETGQTTYFITLQEE